VTQQIDFRVDQINTPEGVMTLNNMIRFLYSKIVNVGEGVDVSVGYGSPESVLTKRVGSIYLRQDGGASTSFYVKESGDLTDTGWIAK